MSIILALALSLQDASQEVDPLAPLPEPEVEQLLDTPPTPQPPAVRGGACPTRSFTGEIVFDETPPRRSAVILCAESDESGVYETMLRSAKREIAFNDLFTVESRSELMARIDEELAALAEEARPSVEEAAPVGR